MRGGIAKSYLFFRRFNEVTTVHPSFVRIKGKPYLIWHDICFTEKVSQDLVHYINKHALSESDTVPHQETKTDDILLLSVKKFPIQ